ncbi:MAG: hypothetical protein K8R88_13255 [Armatimonadetes bacterium]|nr:hypothetical protein [Armatimonadota bacterium]
MENSYLDKLIGALEELVVIGEEETASLQEALRRKDQWRQAFHDSIQGIQSIANLQDDLKRMSEDFPKKVARDFRRESAFLDAFESMMHLFTIPASQAPCEQIAQNLREIRTIPFNDNDAWFTREIPGLESSGMTKISPAKDRMQPFIDLESSTHKWLESRQDKWAEQFARVDSLLDEALKLALKMRD